MFGTLPSQYSFGSSRKEIRAWLQCLVASGRIASVDEVVVADGHAGRQHDEQAERDGHGGQGARVLQEDVPGRVDAVLGVGELRLHRVARALHLVVAVGHDAVHDAAAALGDLRAVITRFLT